VQDPLNAEDGGSGAGIYEIEEHALFSETSGEASVLFHSLAYSSCMRAYRLMHRSTYVLLLPGW
jgi:hypothetical protein